MKLRQLLASLLILIPQAVHAQDTGSGLSFDLSYMTRGEIRNGGLVNGDDSADDFAAFLLGRTRVGVSYAGQGISSRLTAQHSGTWGGQSGTLGVYEAWVQLDTKSGLFFRVGRQNLSYDDQRIFGSDDFSMTGMSHDVLKAGFERKGHKFHVFTAFNQNGENASGGGTYFSGGYQPYKAMESAWYHYDFKRIPLGASLLFLNLGMQGGDKGEDNARTWQQQLAGTYLSLKPKGWTFEGAFYYQMGRSEYGIPIDAWMASSKVTMTSGLKAVFYGGYDYLSGDEHFATPPEGMIGVIQHDKIRGFSSVYGSHHKFYGAMDFFYIATYYRGFTPGLQNLYAGGIWTPSEAFSIDASYHFLATATQLQNAGKPLGHELELSASCKLRKETKISVGYSYMRGTETMKILKRSSDAGQLQWAWIMLTVSPEAFHL